MTVARRHSRKSRPPMGPPRFITYVARHGMHIVVGRGGTKARAIKDASEPPDGWGQADYSDIVPMVGGLFFDPPLKHGKLSAQEPRPC